MKIIVTKNSSTIEFDGIDKTFNEIVELLDQCINGVVFLCERDKKLKEYNEVV